MMVTDKDTLFDAFKRNGDLGLRDRQVPPGGPQEEVLPAHVEGHQEEAVRRPAGSEDRG